MIPGNNASSSNTTSTTLPETDMQGKPATPNKEAGGAKPRPFQPPARVVPKSPRSLKLAPSLRAEPTPPGSPPGDGTRADTLPSSNPAWLPRDTATAADQNTPEQAKEPGKEQGQCPQAPTLPTEQARGRSESSPAKLASPPKPPRPLSRAPQELTVLLKPQSPPASPSTTAKKPPRPASRAPLELTPLNLAALKMPPSSTAPAPGMAPMNSPLKSPLNSPLNSPRNPARVRIFDALGGSSSAPATPRKSSRQRDEFQPLKMDHGLIEIADKIASLCVGELKLTHPVAKAPVINALFKQDIPIRIAQLQAKVKSRLQLDETTTIISHRQLIRGLYLTAFRQSDAGKALLECRRYVMETYGAVDDRKIRQLTLRQMNAKEEQIPGYRTMLKQNMVPQAEGVAEAAFGKQPDLAASGLPPELIAQWKAMDRELCAWGADAKARFSLAYDLLITSLILPVVTGDAKESGLAVPAVFHDAVTEACEPLFQSFVDSFIRIVDAERAASSASTLPTASAALTPTASTGGGSMATTGKADALPPST